MYRKTLLEMAMVTGPKVAGGVLTFSISLVLLRFLNPSEYGFYSLCLAGILIGDAIIGSSLDLAVLRLAPGLRLTNTADCLGIERTALQLKLGLAIALALALAPLAGPLSAEVFHDSAQWPLAYVTFFSVIALLMLRSVLVHAQIEGRFDRYGCLELLHSAVKFGGIALLLLFANPGAFDLLIFFAIGPAVAFTAGIAWWGRPSIASLRVQRGQYQKLLPFAGWYALTGGLGNLVNRLDVFALTVHAAMRDVGIYSGGYLFVTAPTLAASYVSTVFAPRLMPYYETGALPAFYRKTQVPLLLLSTFGGLSAPFAARGLLSVLIPAEFQSSIEVALVLLPGAAVSFATIPIALPLVMFLRPRFLFAMDCVGFPVLIALYYIAARNGGAHAVAQVTCGSLVVRGLVVQLVAWKLAGRAPAGTTPEKSIAAGAPSPERNQAASIASSPVVGQPRT